MAAERLLESPQYVGALAQVLLRASMADRAVDHIEDPYLCEDGSWSLRIWCTDGSDYSVNYNARSVVRRGVWKC